MTGQNKTRVKFLYFQLTVDRKEDNCRKKMLFDLTEFAGEMHDRDLNDRNWNYNGEQIRLKKSYMDENDLLLLQFEKLTTDSLPYIAKSFNQEEKDVPLEKDEFIANDISAIFDPSNSVLMLQRNVHALSQKAIIQYVNHFWNNGKSEDEQEIIEFIPIINPDIYKKAKSSKGYKKITIKTANKYDSKKGRREMFSEAFDGTLGKIISACQPVDGLNIETTFFTSRAKGDTLDDNQVKEILNQIEQNEKLFDKAEISIINDNDQTELLNLLNALLVDFAIFEQKPKTRLRSDVIQSEMKQLYLPKNEGKDRRTKINLILRNKG